VTGDLAAVPTLWSHVASIVDAGCSAVGVQLWAAVRGEVVLDDALGECATGPMSVDAMHSGYCLGKPLLSLAALALVDDGLVDLDAPLRAVDLDVSLRDVLDHHAGLDAPSAMDVRMAPRREQDELLAAGIGRAVRLPAYSEIAGGVVIERLVEAVTGEAAVDYVTTRVLAPLGLDGDVALCGGAARAAVHTGRVSVPIGGLPVTRTPMTSTLLDVHLDNIRPAFDVLWATRSAGRLMDAVGRTLAGEPIDGFVSPSVLIDACIPRRPAFDDRWTKRRMRFAGGFWVDLPGTGVARRPSERAVAAVAGVVNAFAVTDPEACVTVAVYLNGAALDAELAAIERRILCDAAFEDLA
jgi:CubicO group peptidase (beta-lactamase class C family)